MLRGAIDILPLAFSAAAYGLAFGVFSAEAGFSAFEITIMSLTVFAGTSQIAAVDAFNTTQAIWGSVLAACVLNLRYIGILATLPKVFADAKNWASRLLAIHITADENWARTLAARDAGQTVGAKYHIGAGLTLLAFWIVATCVGNIVGAALPEWTSGAVGFAFTAAFIAMLTGMMNIRRDTKLPDGLRIVVPVAVTFAAAIALTQIPSLNDYAVILASLVGLGVAVFIQPKTKAGEGAA